MVLLKHPNGTEDQRNISNTRTKEMFDNLSAGRLYNATITTFSGPFSASSSFVTNATCEYYTLRTCTYTYKYICGGMHTYSLLCKHFVEDKTEIPTFRSHLKEQCKLKFQGLQTFFTSMLYVQQSIQSSSLESKRVHQEDSDEFESWQLVTYICFMCLFVF